MYLANKVQNIKGSADVLLECAGLTFEELAAHCRRHGEGWTQSRCQGGD